MLAHVLGQMPDARREQRDLHLGRPRITVLSRVLPHYLFFVLFVLYYRQLLSSPLCSVILSTYFSSHIYATTHDQAPSATTCRASATSCAICFFSASMPENRFSGRSFWTKV